MFGCGEQAQPSEQQLVSQVTPLSLPVLGCFDAITAPGTCARDADCALGERCTFDGAATWADRDVLPLRCAPNVGTLADGAACTTSDACASGLCGLADRCLTTCRIDLDCGEGRVCRPIEARIHDGTGPVMACARPLILPDDVLVTVAQNGGQLGKGSTTLNTPGCADPAMIYVQASCDDSGIDVLTLRALDTGSDVWNSKDADPDKHVQNTVLHDGSPFVSMLYPDNPALAPSLDGLAVQLHADKKQSADLVMASRPRGLGETLDLNVFYVGGGVDSTGDGYGFRPGEPLVHAMLARLDQRMRPLGLKLGDIREHDVPGALREELAVLEVPKSKVGAREVEGRPLRLDELFSLSAGVDELGINVFLVSDMSSYVGIAGGIPGTIGVHGSSRSGVALAADVLGDLSDADLVLLHELGHFFGLFHTTEASGDVLDPLSDTPECSIDLDADHDGSLSTVECAGHGAENLMFWTGLGALLTPQQIEVITQSVIFR